MTQSTGPTPRRESGQRSGLVPPPLATYGVVALEDGSVFLPGQGCRSAITNQCVGIERAPDGSIKSYDIRKQTEGVIENIRALLETRRLGLYHLVAATIFVKAETDIPTVESVWNKALEEYPTPPKPIIVTVADLPGDNFVEIKARASTVRDFKKGSGCISLPRTVGYDSGASADATVDASNIPAFETQAETAFQSLATTLSTQSLALEHLVDVMVLLHSKESFPTMNAIWNRTFAELGIPPARTTVFTPLKGGNLIELKPFASRLRRVAGR